jgi:phosphomannomutase/phosphoglucomutase
MGAAEVEPLSCFKAYDIRGRVPEDIDETLAWRIGRAYADEIQPGKVVVGRDVRLESPMVAQALTRGLAEGGAEVIDIGLCGTEEVYFQSFHRQGQGVGGGIMVTASHNPKGYNGMKLVREGARPISGDSGLFAIRDRVLDGQFNTPPKTGTITTDTDKTAYVDHLLGYVNHAILKPLKIVADPGNGAAGPAARLLARHLPFELVFIQDEPDGNFPNGVPNPLLPEMRATTAKAVLEHGADFGVAWDGDFDRCFLFDHTGRFIEGYYLVGLLAEVMLAKYPAGKIIHDPRLTWNTISLVEEAGGIPIQSKTGHAFIKERMRREDAIYGGEMSAHHYFRDFAYCDSGMIPWLLVAELMSRTGKSLSQLVSERMAAFPCSGEINYRVEDAPAIVKRVLAYFAPENPKLDKTDGISLEFPDWRFNLRSSNTEPLLRLNVESRGDVDSVSRHVSILENQIKSTF